MSTHSCTNKIKEDSVFFIIIFPETQIHVFTQILWNCMYHFQNGKLIDLPYSIDHYFIVSCVNKYLFLTISDVTVTELSSLLFINCLLQSLWICIKCTVFLDAGTNIQCGSLASIDTCSLSENELFFTNVWLFWVNLISKTYIQVKNAFR